MKNNEATRLRAKPDTPETYLWRKPHARYLWFRQSVPTRYRSVDSRKLIQRSLGTKDLRLASIKAAKLRAELHEQWEAMLPAAQTPIARLDRPAIEPDLIDMTAAAAEAAFSTVLPKLERLRLSKGLGTNASFLIYLESLKSQLLRLVRTRDTDMLPVWQRVADRMIYERNWLLDKESARYGEFVSMIAEAGIEALRIDIERNEGKVLKPTSPVVTAGLEARKGSAKPGETLLALFDRYAAQRTAEKRKRADTLVQDRKVVERLAEFVGRDRSLASIGRPDIRNWRDTLATVPANYKKHKAYAGLSLPEVAAKAKGAGAKALSLVTLNRYLSAVSAFFAWAGTNAYMEGNPCDGLFYDAQKGKNPRPPFSEGQIQRIFQSPLFTGFERDGREHKPGSQTAEDWRFWIPIVCLFTGARIGEIAQLRLDDIAEEDGTPFIHIRDDEKTGQKTKSGFSRVAPIHSELATLGFLAFVERQRRLAGDDKGARLFPQLEPNEREQIGAKPSRFWRKYLQKIGLKAGADGLGSHSFRHTMADRLRLADYLDDEIEVCLGHNQKSVTGGYGQVRQGTLGRLHSMFESISFILHIRCPKYEHKTTLDSLASPKEK